MAEPLSPRNHVPGQGEARPQAGIPPLVALLMRNAALGFCVAALFIGAMVLFDVGGLGGLVMNSPDGLIAVGALTFATGLTFGSVQMGIAIMQLAERDEGDSGRGGRRMPVQQLAHAVVRRRHRAQGHHRRAPY